MSFDIEVRDGWLWPKSDTELWKVARDYTILEMALEHCTQRRVAIQAGGACGTFPNWLSQYFETVYTFEPDPVNFTCLVANCQKANVVKIQAALGDLNGTGAVVSEPGNCGAGHVAAGERGADYMAASYGLGSVPIIKFGCVRESMVDLIQLDVEGMETAALNGLGMRKPVVVVEDKGLHERFGDDSPADRLLSWGYTEVGSYRRDKIFKRAA